MQQNPTRAIREPCEFCGGQHDEMECFRNDLNEEKMYDDLFDIATRAKEIRGEFPSPLALIENYFEQDLKSREIESVIGIAEDAIADAKLEA